MVVFGKGGIKKKPRKVYFSYQQRHTKNKERLFFIVTQSNNEKVFKISWIKCAVYIGGK